VVPHAEGLHDIHAGRDLRIVLVHGLRRRCRGWRRRWRWCRGGRWRGRRAGRRGRGWRRRGCRGRRRGWRRRDRGRGRGCHDRHQSRSLPPAVDNVRQLGATGKRRGE
jgi:hypothetical protein